MTPGSTLLAFDFDGTLAPICDDPSQVRLDRGAAALLAETTAMEGIVVAIVSGRVADDLAHRVNVPGVYAGDDITDFGPLRFASEHGRALFLASDERVPPPGVTVVGSFRELFRIVRQEVML